MCMYRNRASVAVQEACREKVLLSENLQIKIILDV